MSRKDAFEFGRNWDDFSRRALDVETVAAAEESLEQLLGGGLRGKSFLDVGCGSGLFSIAAARLGASPVLGVDIDPECVEVSRGNASRFRAGAERVEFRQLSALDRDGLLDAGTHDVVYAWGSLHHTGRMWDAIGNAAATVRPGGVFVLAIYNKHFTSSAWKVIKKTYNLSPAFMRKAMIYLFAGIIYVAKLAVTRRNPVEKQRGMNFMVDVVDWVGGYPYEYATRDEITRFVEGLGFGVKKIIPAQVPTGCNEFVFERNR